MKSEYLREIGITDQETIDKIMAQNGRDIENAKKGITELETKVEGLESQLQERDDQLKELKKSAGDNEKLTAKIEELENTNKATTAEYEGKIEAMRKEYEIESKLRDAKAKNLKAVKALLNPDEDLDKQIKTLTEGEDTAFLFESTTPKEPPKPNGFVPNGGKPKPSEHHATSFRDAVANALKTN